MNSLKVTSLSGIAQAITSRLPRLDTLSIVSRWSDLSILLVLLTVFSGSAWGTVPTLADLDFGTPIVEENFNRLSTTSSTTKETPAADLSGFGAFNKVYSGNGSNTYAIDKNVTTTSFVSNCLALTSAGSNMLQVHISGLTFGTTGAWRLKTTKSSYAQFGINVDNGGNNYGTNTRVFVENNQGTIKIQSGDGYQSVATNIATEIIDICVIYNKSGSSQTYGGSITLANNKAHVYINGVCIMNGESPMVFNIPSADFTNAIFRIHPYTGSGNKAYIDDVQIWNSLPSSKAAHSTTYSVTLKDNNDVLTEASIDSGVQLPSRGGEGFLGWSHEDCGASWLAADIPFLTTIFPAGSTYYPNGDTDLYPIYSNGVFRKYKLINFDLEDWSGTYLMSGRSGVNIYTATGVIDGEGKYLVIDNINPDTITVRKTAREFLLSPTSGGYYHIQFPDGDYLIKSGDGALFAKTSKAGLPGNNYERWNPTAAKIYCATTTGRWIAYSNPSFKMYTTGATAQLYAPMESYRSLAPEPSQTDYFVDILHDNEVPDQTGTYSMPDISDESAGSYCEGQHYKFLGWVAEDDIDENGSLKDGYTLIAPGTEMTADNITYYAIWAKDVE